MKISITIAVLILVLAAVLGWRDRRKLSSVTETHRALTEEAAALGLALGQEGSEGEVLVTKRAREDKDAEAKLAAKDFIAFALEMQSMKETGEQPDEAMQERIGVFMDRMLSLDAGQLKILIAEFRASTEMDDETRNGMTAFAIMTLANDHPEAALNLFIESQDILGEGMMGKHVLSNSLEKWASTDPDGALDWVRKNGEKHPDLITDDVKLGLVKGAATNSLKQGFDLIGELGLKNWDDAFGSLAQGLKTQEERTHYLTLLREFTETGKEIGRESATPATSSLADGIVKDGFEAGSKWIFDNELSQKEIDGLLNRITYSTKGGDTGKWIEWMGENVSDDQRAKSISNTMRNWTRNDYRAAGEWLATAPEGDTKNAAVKSYAETVAEYDPATAAQWALTLPKGEQRSSTLRNIHSNMPDKTPEEKTARQTFQEQHGIE